jgi:Fe-S-cluster-containing dehydrogenase component
MAAAMLTASGSTARAAITDGKPQIATLVDISKCIGCEACVDACGEVNADKYPDPKKPFPEMFPPRVKVSDWSDKQDVTDRLTPYNWLERCPKFMIKRQHKLVSMPRQLLSMKCLCISCGVTIG